MATLWRGRVFHFGHDWAAGLSAENTYMIELLRKLFGGVAGEPNNNGELETRLREQLIRDEGEVLHAYTDTEGYWTIGIGRLIDRRKGGGITKAESTYLFNNDLERVQKQVFDALPWARQLDEARQGVLLNMCFQMGLGNAAHGTGLLGFKNTLAMIERGDYESAAKGMLNSLWAKQTPLRAKRLSKQMETGEWQ